MPGLDLAKHPLNASPPRGDGKRYPLVVLLRGDRGLDSPHGEMIRTVADGIAGCGYVTAVPSYYTEADPDPADDDPEPHVSNVAAAIEELTAREDVDPGRLGIVGFSLGGAIAMSLMGGGPPGSANVFVDYHDPTPKDGDGGLADLPLTAIFHNRRDASAETSPRLAGLLSGEIDVRLSVFTEDFPPFLDGFGPNRPIDETTRWIALHLPPGGQ